MRLALELALARSAGRLSRLAGRGGGTTHPRQDPRHDRPRRGLDAGRAAARAVRPSISATNGKTTTAALVAAIVGKRVRLAHNGSGANLVSGVASTLIEARDAELGLFEVDEGAFPEVARRIRPRAVCLGNLFRDQLDRYGELEQIAERWRAAVAGASGRRPRWSSTRDDPQVGDLAACAPGTRHLRHRRPAQARPSLQHAADSKYCLRCGTPYEYAAAYVGHLGDYRCPACGHARPPLDVAAREIELARARGGLVRPRHAGGHPPGPARAARALQRLQRARRRVARAGARRRRSTRSQRGLERRRRRSAVSSASTSATGGCCSC